MIAGDNAQSDWSIEKFITRLILIGQKKFKASKCLNK